MLNDNVVLVVTPIAERFIGGQIFVRLKVKSSIIHQLNVQYNDLSSDRIMLKSMTRSVRSFNCCGTEEANLIAS